MDTNTTNNSNVQFEGENGVDSGFQSREILGRPTTPPMVKFLVSKGVVKSEKTAGRALLVVAGVFFLLSIYFFLN